jgi:hypothetical protein
VMLSGRTSSCRFLMLGLAGASCFLLGSRSAQATGCHIPDRPVLAHTFSWERWQSSGSSRQGMTALPSPPAVRRLPCEGEIPTLPSPGNVPLGQALTTDLNIQAPPRGERAVVHSPESIPLVLASRLDRPPRLAWV